MKQKPRQVVDPEPRHERAERMNIAARKLAHEYIVGLMARGVPGEKAVKLALAAYPEARR